MGPEWWLSPLQPCRGSSPAPSPWPERSQTHGYLPPDVRCCGCWGGARTGQGGFSSFRPGRGRCQGTGDTGQSSSAPREPQAAG